MMKDWQQWLAVARRHSVHAHEAEDLLQEAMLIAWRCKRNPLDNDVDARWFSGVLRQHGLFRARTAGRRRAREAASFEHWREAVSPEPADDLAIERFLEVVPPKLAAAQRRVLLLALCGHGRAAICRVLGLSPAALRQRLTALRRELPLDLAGSTDQLQEISAGLQNLMATSGPTDAGQRARSVASLARGPSLPGLRFAVSDPDGHFLGLGTESSRFAPRRQLNDGNGPDES